MFESSEPPACAPPVPDVLIVSYRRRDLLENCLESVGRWLPSAQIRVWDNRSEGSPEIQELAQDFPDVHWTFADTNVGFAAAVNGLMRTVTSGFALLLNPDAELAGSMAGCRRLLASDAAVAAAAPNLVEPGQEPWDNAHREPTWARHLVSYAGWENRIRRFAPLSLSYRDRPLDVGGYLTGACLFISMDAWRAVGEFDERYFLYGEEADWCHRARRRGLRLVSVDEPGVVHSAGGTVADQHAALTRSEQFLAESRVRYIRDQQGHAAATAFRAGAAVLERTQTSKRSRPRIPRTPDAPPVSDVIVTTPTLGVGGAERQRVALVNGLAAHLGHVEIRALQSWGQLEAGLDPRVRRTLAPYTTVERSAGSGTLLVTGTSRIELAFGLAWRARNFPNGRWVVALHQPPRDHAVFPAPVAAVMRRADGVIYLSESHRSDHRRHQKLDTGRWWIVPNGIDVSGEGDVSPGAHGASATRLRMVTASRLTDVKKVDLLVRALASAPEGYLADIDWSLDIWGEGPARPEVEAEITAAVRDRITLRGWCPDVPRMLHEADLFCVPSAAEAQPMSILEAMAVGVPVVSTTVAAVPEMLDGGRAGYLVEPSTEERWRQVLEEVAHDATGRAEKAVAARQRVTQRYSTDAMIEGYLRVREELLGS